MTRDPEAARWVTDRLTAPQQDAHAKPSEYSYPVESGIPIPPERSAGPGGYRGHRRYPWGLMNVGDSFLVPAHDEPAFVVTARSLHAAVRTWKYNNGYDDRVYVTRRIKEGVRIWRTK